MASESQGPLATFKSLLFKMAIALAAIYIVMFVFTTEQIAYYYPYPDDTTIYSQSEEYLYTYAGCREWARTKAREEENAQDGVFACGRRCTYDEAQEYYRCDKISPSEPLYQAHNEVTPQMILSM